ncbi:MAG TPA: DUF123 domain-containing protein [Alphaproteobacteria bacterium]|nr:DUF123 domain-containing protein [Alphaproteobacteria bacterium]MDP7163732.1 DUF123 domain-containing protein [Alphaproteobacteria bacterium]MDP7427158.1 DUF123 domain-containing protein [Alphaproteobacteria bacterium]HJM50199.1 DUF123 domain-containing protein [Alphaproteobacteria bacterium]
MAGVSRTMRGALAGVPEGAGAYALVLDLRAPRRLPQRLAPQPLAPGPYLYAGSARGPGGPRARLARHLRRQKPRHWHLDWLTGAPPALVRFYGFAAFAAAGECDVVDWLTARGATQVPGFGASDCRRCQGHLLALSRAPGLGELAEALAGTLIWSRDIPRIR